MNNRINQFEKLAKYTDFRTRLQFMNAFIQGRLSYMIATYTNLNEKQINKIHKVIMRAARLCLQSYCFKERTNSILDRCHWRDAKETIIIANLKFIHNLIINKKPEYLYNQLKFGRRSCSQISFYDIPSSAKRKNTLLYQGINWYNKLPMYLN